MFGIDFDNTISVEGAATALGVAGAAIGYLINLVRQWLQQAHEKRMRGTSFVIIEMLEHASSSVHEDALYAQYRNPASQQMVTKYAATTPGKLDRVSFERQLRSLQLDGMVAPVGRDEWRVVLRPLPGYEADDAFNNQVASLLNTEARRNKAVEMIRKMVNNNRGQELTRMLRFLMRFNPAVANEVFDELLNGGTVEQRLAVCDILSELPPSHVSAPPSSP